MKASFAFALLAATLACTSTPIERARPRERPSSIRHIRTDTYEGVIFDRWAPEYPSWIPSSDQIDELESALPEYLRQHPVPDAPALESKLVHYKRQYYGLIDEDGHSAILAFLFCRWSNDWKREPYHVPNGGDCYVSVYYDVISHEVLVVIPNTSP